MKQKNIRDRVEYIYRTIVSGMVVEKIKTQLVLDKDSRRSRREQAKRQRTTHDTGAVPRVARHLNANFGHKTKSSFTLLTYRPEEFDKLCRRAEELGELPGYGDYDRQRLIAMAAKEECSKWIERVQYECRNRGIVFKYVYVTADGHEGDEINGELAEQYENDGSARVHHHVVLNDEVLEIAKRKWRAGHVMAKPLWRNQKDRTPIADYMLKQVRYTPHDKAYTVSRNLEKPRISQRIVYSDRMPEAPKGADIMYRSEWKPGLPMYIRYVNAPVEDDGETPQRE